MSDYELPLPVEQTDPELAGLLQWWVHEGRSHYAARYPDIAITGGFMNQCFKRVKERTTPNPKPKDTMKVAFTFDSLEEAMKALVASGSIAAVSAHVPVVVAPHVTPALAGSTPVVSSPAAATNKGKRRAARIGEVAPVASTVTAPVAAPVTAAVAPVIANGTVSPLEQVRAALIAHSEKNGADVTSKILNEVGKAAKLSQVNPELFPALIAALASAPVKKSDPFNE